MRVDILTSVVLLSTISWMPSALAQMTPQEHEGEPPASVVQTGPQVPRAGRK